MISLVALRNFKCFKSIAMRVAPITLLTGMNGMGKSSVFQALLILRQSKSSGDLDEGRLLLGGELFDAGTGVDIFFEDAHDDTITLAIEHDGEHLTEYRYGYDRQADTLDQLPEIRADEYTLRSIVEDGFELYSDNFAYIQAERSGPRKTFPMSESRARRGDLGVHGEYVLHSLKIRENDVLAIGDARVLEGVAPRLTEQVEGWLQHVSPGCHLAVELVRSADMAIGRFSFDREGDVPTRGFRATHVGFGLSYVLPVIAALLTVKSGGLVLIENPEAHLHPRGQTRLGQLAARAAAAGVQVMIETHSDHFMDGVRIAVRDAILAPDQCAFHYFSRTGAIAQVSSPIIDANGRLSDWPRGFFDQHDENLARLIAPKS